MTDTTPSTTSNASPSADDLTYEVDVTDVHGMTRYGQVVARKDGGSPMGRLDWAGDTEEMTIQMIEVDQDFRGQGIATRLMETLYETFPEAKIDHGYQTEDGHGFVQSFLRRRAGQRNREDIEIVERLSVGRAQLEKALTGPRKETGYPHPGIPYRPFRADLESKQRGAGDEDENDKIELEVYEDLRHALGEPGRYRLRAFNEEGLAFAERLIGPWKQTVGWEILSHDLLSDLWDRDRFQGAMARCQYRDRRHHEFDEGDRPTVDPETVIGPETMQFIREHPGKAGESLSPDEIGAYLAREHTQEPPELSIAQIVIAHFRQRATLAEFKQAYMQRHQLPVGHAHRQFVTSLLDPAFVLPEQGDLPELAREVISWSDIEALIPEKPDTEQEARDRFELRRAARWLDDLPNALFVELFDDLTVGREQLSQRFRKPQYGADEFLTNAIEMFYVAPERSVELLGPEKIMPLFEYKDDSVRRRAILAAYHNPTFLRELLRCLGETSDRQAIMTTLLAFDEHDLDPSQEARLNNVLRGSFRSMDSSEQRKVLQHMLTHQESWIRRKALLWSSECNLDLEGSPPHEKLFDPEVEPGPDRTR